MYYVKKKRKQKKNVHPADPCSRSRGDEKKCRFCRRIDGEEDGNVQ